MTPIGSLVSLPATIGNPGRKKDNALSNIAIIPWLGANFIPGNTEMSRVFENTGSVYNIPAPLRPTIGLNLSYTIFQKINPPTEMKRNTYTFWLSTGGWPVTCRMY